MGRGTTSLIAPNQADHAAGGAPHHRRHRHRLPAHARDRGAGGDELPLPAVQGAEPGGERLPHDAQPVPDPRREDARFAGLVEVPGCGAERLHRRHRRRHRPAPLAHLGPRACAQVHHRAARPVPADARPDAAADEPRPDAARDCRELPPARVAGEELARAALLRRHRAQRARGVRALHGPLRRQPGEPGPAGAAAGCGQVRRVHGRCRRAAGARPGRLRRRPLPLGGAGDAPPGVRRPDEPACPPAGGRCDGAAGLPERKLDLAQRLCAGREGAAFRRAEAAARRHRHRHAQGGGDAADGHVLRLPGDARQCREGRRSAVAHRLGDGRRDPSAGSSRSAIRR